VPRLSAGLLLYRMGATGIEVLLVHPGGPFWARRDTGAWSIPKGEYEPGEDPRRRAEAEFSEELGSVPPSGPRRDLDEVTQAGGKRVRAWAVRGEFDTEGFTSNTFEMEWPRGSGVHRTFPEVDQAQWFTLDEARRKVIPGQLPFLERLVEVAGGD